MLGEEYGPRQKRRLMYKTITSLHGEYNTIFRRCDCLRLGLLFIEEHRALPSTYSYTEEEYMPSRYVIIELFGTNVNYQQALRKLCMFSKRDFATFVRMETYPIDEEWARGGRIYGY